MDGIRRHWRRRPGVALLLVLMIGLLAFVAVTGLLGAVASGRRIVGGEAISDRSVALADGFIDQLLAQVNAAQELTKSGLSVSESTDSVVARLLSMLNGGNPDSDTLVQIRAGVRSYVYDSSTSTYYRADGASFSKGILTSGTLVSLDDSSSPETITGVDPSFASDNRWFQIDTNCDYCYASDKPDIWRLRATAFNISAPELRRTVQADAGRSEVSIGGNPNWYRRVVGPVGETTFCQYAGFYGTDVAFGRYDVVTGSIRCNGNIDMNGWAQAHIYARYHVTGSGWFGPNRWNLNRAKVKAYAVENYPAGDWIRGSTALYGANPVRSTTDSGMQDQCLPAYYVNGDATVLFTVEGDVGNVTITPAGGMAAKLDMPSNGIIFVEGNAWVGGAVHGRCTLGCRGTINIQDNIIYSVAPRVDRSKPMPPVPDALGLVAGQQVFIPKATYDTHRTLRIDAAMFCGSGGLQIDPAASSHKATATPHYEAFWNGSQSMYNASKTPLVDFGNGYVRGYELQHTNLDWNLKDYGAPPMFPGTGTTAIPGEVDWVLLKTRGDSTILSQLNGVTAIALDASASDYDPQTATFYEVVAGTRYYTSGSLTTVYAKYSPEQNALSYYRVSSREQIATPVRQP
ncbi:MAG TPA: hypothetical protein VIJ80_03755 [Candidatus Cryosericum sp.]